MLVYIFFHSLFWLHLAFILELLHKLFPPLLRRILLGSLDIVTVRVREVIEAICFVVVSLELFIHASLFYALLDVLAMLLLHGSFLLNFNLVKLLDLVANSGIFQALLLEIVDFLLSLRLSSRLCLLHVLFHIVSGVLVGSLVEEEGAFASVHLPLEERLERHLRQEFVVFKRIHDFLLDLARVHRAAPGTTLKSVVGVRY